MSAYFQRFESRDKGEFYDVYLDSLGKLSSYLDLAIVHRMFNKQGRLMKTIGYGPDGTYSFWDFPPILEIDYRSDTTIETDYNYKYKFLSRKTTINDKWGRATEIIYEEAKDIYFDRTINIYNDSLNEVTIAHYDKSQKLKKDKNGVAFIYRKFDLNGKDIIEQRFLDIHRKLVDATHEFDHTRTGCIFSIVYRECKKGEWVTNYYNSAGKNMCEEIASSPGVIIYSH